MKPNRLNLFRIKQLLVVTGFFAMNAGAHAAIQTWKYAGPNNNWNTTELNWDAGVVWATNNSATLGGTGETVTLTTDITANGLAFNSSDFVISGNTLTLGTTAQIIKVANSTDTATISSI